MPFLPRNRYYLRISSSSILPLYVYLDSQHVDWMSDRVLRQIVADLRPRILPKLRAESDAHLGPGPAPANAKRGTVDVHRGDTYQFAYFLRETEPHSVLLKMRNFVLDTKPPPPTSSGPAKPTEQQSTERKVSSRKERRHKTRVSRKARGRRVAAGSSEEEDHQPSDPERFGSDNSRVEEDEEVETMEDSNMNTTEGMRGVTDEDTSTDVKVEKDERHGLPQTESSHVGDADAPIEVDEDDEPKPKLALELKYQEFSNFSRCLCVVVEPWPPQHSGTHAPLVVPSVASRVSTVTPTASEFTMNRGQRAKTPLFFPDVDDEPTALASGHSHPRHLPPVPLFDEPPTTHETDDVEEWDDNAELMQFSQMLNTTGRVGGANVEEEDDFDGTALFADADEAKEL